MEDEQLEVLFRKHFGGLYWTNITKEMILEFAVEYGIILRSEGFNEGYSCAKKEFSIDD